MARFLIPLILIGAAIGLFVVYTNPSYQHTKELALQKQSYDDALTKLNGLLKRRDDLLAQRSAFAADDVVKLEHVLPDNVDNIRLVIDINNIAARHGLVLTDVSLGTVSDGAAARSAVAVGPSGGDVGSVEVGFAVKAKYEEFVAFLQDVEHSLRIVDVDKISFVAGPTDTNTYTFTIRTYWLH